MSDPAPLADFLFDTPHFVSHVFHELPRLEPVISDLSWAALFLFLTPRPTSVKIGEVLSKEKIMSQALVALLDRPSEKSFGMVPILIHERESGSYIVYGLKGGATPLLLPGSMTVQDYVSGNCRNTASSAISFSVPPLGKVAGWIGSIFLDECRRLHAPVPEVPKDASVHKDNRDTQTPGGVFWIGNSSDVYARLEAWLYTAAVVACQRRCHETATLMNWCLPDRIETHAAIWYTAPDQQHRERELNWLIRTWYQRRDPALTEEALEIRLMQVAEKILASQPG